MPIQNPDFKKDQTLFVIWGENMQHLVSRWFVKFGGQAWVRTHKKELFTGVQRYCLKRYYGIIIFDFFNHLRISSINIKSRSTCVPFPKRPLLRALAVRPTQQTIQLCKTLQKTISSMLFRLRKNPKTILFFLKSITNINICIIFFQSFLF